MINANILLSNNNPIKNYNEKNFSLNETIHAIAAMSELNNQSCIIIDFDNQKVVFKSKHLIYIDETIKSDIQKECANPYWALISDNTYQVLLSIREKFLKMRYMINLEEYIKSISTLEFPISIKGKDFFIHQRFIPLTLRQDGIIKYGLFVFSNSNKTKIEATIRTPTGRIWSYDLNHDNFCEDDTSFSLTDKEKSILLRIQKGMTSKEIADCLFVSTNTIKTHRMRIFKKLGVTSMTEALSFLKNHHIL